MEDLKVIDLESRIAHQEHAIAELNDVLTSQQAQITLLEGRVEALLARVRALSEATSAAPAGDERPPHY
ncbi:MAG: SlyX family protein [Gammaproteobacteria bacterium]|nr:SlyX family protein [Gammaproteobacteria bacterium]